MCSAVYGLFNTLQDELNKDNKQVIFELQKIIGKEVSFFARLFCVNAYAYVD